VEAHCITARRGRTLGDFFAVCLRSRSENSSKPDAISIRITPSQIFLKSFNMLIGYQLSAAYCGGRRFIKMKLPRKEHAKAVNTNGSFKGVYGLRFSPV
jgi:hypothetical protein